ncbi:hypothetical protein GCM10009682_52030 [Luedemannella flava]|uniref:DUF2795 domain-containing protein n=2 Tax=Luedemannella flava TaxID=349316 RepID=A0ABP4YNX6_9ACTN
MAREMRDATSRARDWDAPEPAGDDQPTPRLLPYGEMTGPLAPSPAEIAERSEFGKWIPRSVLPADRDALAEVVRSAGAPDRVVDQIDSLPPDLTFETVVQIWGALGHATEARAG